MSVFKKQSLLTLKLETNYDDLAAATVKRILFKRPDGTEGFWNADQEGTLLVYNLQNGDINKEGNWQFQTYIEVGGKNAPGTIVNHFFERPLYK